jgi:hypothetical protein
MIVHPTIHQLQASKQVQVLARVAVSHKAYVTPVATLVAPAETKQINYNKLYNNGSKLTA